MPNINPISRYQKLLVKAIFVCLAAILLYQYLLDRSLWLDESFLAMSLIRRSFGGLLRPLDYSQVAPILFIWVEKAMALLFGNSELSLRAFPLLCSILSLWLIYTVALALTRSRLTALLAMCLLGLSPKFVYYSSEVKQYASDLFVLLSIYTLAFTRHPWLDKHRLTALTVIGIASVFLSNIAVVPLFTVGLWLLARMWRARKIQWGQLIMMSLWAGAFWVNYLVFIRSNPYAADMRAYWQGSFMPTRIFHAEFAAWMQVKGEHVFKELLPGTGNSALTIYTVLLYAGSLLYLLYRRNFQLVFLCLLPVLVHLLISAFQMYPFEIRLILYHLPLYLIVIASGLVGLSRLLVRMPYMRYGFLALLVFAFSLSLWKQYPMYNEEIRPVLSFMNKSEGPRANLYLYYGCKPAYHYYLETGFVKFPVSSTIEGDSHTDNYQGYLDELRGVKGPTWILFSHVYPFDGSRGEEKFIVSGLKKRGSIMKSYCAHGSSAYLVDLN